ncbi:uncharacterized protein B0H64DRAFT_417099 [Chaetomium fimeti]|uniref:Uncharacterized protein n=1 Tax=Chaetomium fimeti TaxID=1854472 RepID=A0AAE0HF21_9PEZI|nr:hypothetical protein B0H64DRAFT_417099 [Chaetomium fimeti]
MVRATLTTVALLAVCRAVGAAPAAAEPAVVTSDFSFAKWVDELIANPDTAMTPDQAVEAFNAARNNTGSTEHSKRGDLTKRVSCNEKPGTEAPVSDAVACINYLASLGQQKCECQYYKQFCKLGGAQLTGQSGTKTVTVACNDIARAGGLIMDSCTRSDNTVQGSEWAWGSSELLVRIHNA